MRLTVGPLPPAVYWRRRAVVLGALLLVVIVLFVSCCGDDDGNKRDPARVAGTDARVGRSTPRPSRPFSDAVPDAARRCPTRQTCESAGEPEAEPDPA